MVLVTCLCFLPAPLKMVRQTVTELLEGAPPAAIQAGVDTAVADLCERFELDQPDVRVTKIGPKLYVQLLTTVAPTVTVAEQQAVYDQLKAGLQKLPVETWLTVELTPRP